MPLNNSDELCRIKGILFDVDGTFYYQTPFRAIMILLFVSFNVHNPKELLRKAKVITAYRKAQETLRYSLQGSSNCSIRQIDLAINNTGESHGYVSKTIIEWFEKRPLLFLRLCRRRGLNSVLCLLHRKGFKLGVFSDYPAKHKLLALKIYKYFSTVMSTNDPEVKGFKPKTDGFAVAARRMGLKPAEVLYVGDRAEVDGIGASAVGMPVVILKSFLDLKKSCDYPILRSFDGLPKIFNLSH